jgi:hypothetical protein
MPTKRSKSRPRSPVISRPSSPGSPGSPIHQLNSYSKGWTEEKRGQATIWKKGNRKFHTVSDALKHARTLAHMKKEKELRQGATILMNLQRHRSKKSPKRQRR